MGNWGLGTVTVIDGASNAVITTVEVADYPWNIAVDQTTNRIYVLNAPDGIISVIDGGNNKVIATVPVGFGPWDIDVNPITNRIYVSIGSNGSISVLGYLTDRLFLPLVIK